MSLTSVPVSESPLSYVIPHDDSEVVDVDDLLASYVACFVPLPTSGSQMSPEPESSRIVNACAGVPTEIGPE